MQRRDIMEKKEEETTKCGTITVSVYKDKFENRFFHIQSDSEDVLPVSYIIEDTLFLY